MLRFTDLGKFVFSRRDTKRIREYDGTHYRRGSVDTRLGGIWAGYLVQMYVLGKADEGWQVYADTCGDGGEFYVPQVESMKKMLRDFGYICLIQEVGLLFSLASER